MHKVGHLPRLDIVILNITSCFVIIKKCDDLCVKDLCHNEFMSEATAVKIYHYEKIFVCYFIDQER